MYEKDHEAEDRTYWTQNVPYGDGHYDGVSGNAFRKDYPADRMEYYASGFEMGRKHLRESFQRMLMNDYGAVKDHS